MLFTVNIHILYAVPIYFGLISIIVDSCGWKRTVMKNRVSNSESIKPQWIDPAAK